VTRVLGGAVVALVMVSSVWAQDAPMSRADRHRELAAMVDTYLLMQVQERVGLSNDQFARVMPLIRRLQADRREMMEARRGEIRKLRALLAAGNATDASVSPVLEQLRATEQSVCQKIIEDMQGIDGILTPLQQAKYRVLEAEVEKRIRHLRRRAGGRGPQFPAPQGEDPPE
jgi:Spy/CpxP family protein refolding chaperone